LTVVPLPNYSEVRPHEENRRLRAVSESTLWYMHDHWVSHESRLRDHSRHLGYLAEDEYDLLNAMRLSSRCASVERNIASTERRVDRLRSELLRRSTDRR